MIEFTRAFVYMYVVLAIVSWTWFPEYLGYAYKASYDKFMIGWSSVK